MPTPCAAARAPTHADVTCMVDPSSSCPVAPAASHPAIEAPPVQSAPIFDATCVDHPAFMSHLHLGGPPAPPPAPCTGDDPAWVSDDGYSDTCAGYAASLAWFDLGPPSRGISGRGCRRRLRHGRVLRGVRAVPVRQRRFRDVPVRRGRRDLDVDRRVLDTRASYAANLAWFGFASASAVEGTNGQGETVALFEACCASYAAHLAGSSRRLHAYPPTSERRHAASRAAASSEGGAVYGTCAYFREHPEQCSQTPVDLLNMQSATSACCACGGGMHAEAPETKLLEAALAEGKNVALVLTHPTRDMDEEYLYITNANGDVVASASNGQVDADMSSLNLTGAVAAGASDRRNLKQQRRVRRDSRGATTVHFFRLGAGDYTLHHQAGAAADEGALGHSWLFDMSSSTLLAARRRLQRRALRGRRGPHPLPRRRRRRPALGAQRCVRGDGNVAPVHAAPRRPRLLVHAAGVRVQGARAATRPGRRPRHEPAQPAGRGGRQ